MGELQLNDPLISIAVLKHGTRICVLPTLYMLNEPYSLAGHMIARCEWDTGWLAPGIYSIGTVVVKSYIGGRLAATILST